MIPKDAMYKKFEALDDLNLNSNLLIVQENIIKWSKAKPDNKELQSVRDAVLKVSLLVNKLRLDRENYHIAMSEYIERSNRSVQRSWKAEQRIEKLEKLVALYKKREELGL